MIKRVIIGFIIILGLIIYACGDEFLVENPQGPVFEENLKNPEGINDLLIGTYAAVDGDGSGGTITNWVWGSVTSDDAYKGSEPNDAVQFTDIEKGLSRPDIGSLPAKWDRMYNGIYRANTVLRILPEVEGLSDNDRIRIAAEARFLRGFMFLELKKMFINVPFIDETAIAIEDFNVPNTSENGDYVDIWPNIEEDFQFAIDNLPDTQAQVGRPTRYAAIAFKAKTHMFQQEFTAALPLFNEIINSGIYTLAPSFHDNFRTEGNNNEESLWEVQQSVNDGDSSGRNGRWGDILQGLQGGPGSCCGFHQPSQNLVNAFRTDADGLPLLNTFNDQDAFDSDEGLPSDNGWNSETNYNQNTIVSRFDPATPHVELLYRAVAANSGADPLESVSWELIWAEDEQVSLDPRLDWTIGRRGIPYLDWGIFPGDAWVRDASHGGAYVNKKQMYYQAEKGQNSTNVGWSQNPNAKNIKVMRYANVLLMAAECEIEVGSLDTAREYVDMIRERAANDVPTEYLDDSNPMGGFSEIPSANYNIGLYADVIGTGSDPFTAQESARIAVRFERRLELAMEGYRFFDLRRWGIAEEIMSAYFLTEQTKRTYLNGSSYTTPRNNSFPIPQEFINRSLVNGTPVLKQNPGY